jgi:sporulation protein YlmC with PRC-barrel domain
VALSLNLNAERNSVLFASVKQAEDAFKRSAEMRINYALATTSVLALLAGPALAQAPAANTDSGSAKPGAAAAGGSNITVQQPAPAVTVKPDAPDVKVQTDKPNVTVTQPPAQVTVKNPEPNVQVQTGQPDVKVLPAEKPNVTVNQTPGKPDVNVGTATAPDARAPRAGAAAVAPATGTFPVAKDVESLMGKDVYGADGKDVGDLENVLVGPNGRVRAAIVEFGGFLGIGEHKVAVPWEELNIQGDRVTVNMTEDQVKAMPRWNKDRPDGEFAEYKPYR